MISKYGMSREAMHFGNIIESSLPLITDTELFSPLEENLEETAKKFRDKIFLTNNIRTHPDGL
jgi:hypothetical protein